LDPDPALLVIVLFVFDVVPFLNGMVLVVLLLCSALISGSEVALFSLTPADFEQEEERGGGGGGEQSKTQQIVARLLDKPKKLLATILIANNFINIAIVLLFSKVGTALWGHIDYKIAGVIDLKFIIEVILVTFLILFFGEILPKVYASRNKVKFSNFMAVPLGFLDKIFWPISSPMRAITLQIHERLGKKKSNISVDQLSQALELTSENDTTKEEKKILQGIVSFGNTDVKQVMRPRMDIFALNQEASYAQIIPQIVKNGFSRIPVYENSIDSVIGILYVKDLLPHIEKQKFDWINLLRAPYFVPENKKLDDLLNDFKVKRNHLAIVVDEYGGTSGLISLEDIIEEIVGDISDEFDDESLIFSKLDDHNYIFEGRTSLKDFYRVIKVENPAIFEEKRGEAETVAGLLLEVHGSFPKNRDVILIGGYSFTIEAMDDKRIKQVKFSMHAD